MKRLRGRLRKKSSVKRPPPQSLPSEKAMQDRVAGRDSSHSADFQFFIDFGQANVLILPAAKVNTSRLQVCGPPKPHRTVEWRERTSGSLVRSMTTKVCLVAFSVRVSVFRPLHNPCEKRRELHASHAQLQAPNPFQVFVPPVTYTS